MPSWEDVVEIGCRLPGVEVGAAPHGRGVANLYRSACRIRRTASRDGELAQSLREVVAATSGVVTRRSPRCADGSNVAAIRGLWRMSVAPRALFATPPDLCAARRAAGQHGGIRCDQLGECGLDRAAIARRVRKGWLHRVHHGVYAVGFPPQTLEAHFSAAVLAGGDEASLSHWASCANAGLVRWDGRPIDVTVRGESHRSAPWHSVSPSPLARPARRHANSRHPVHHARARHPRDRAAAVGPPAEAARPEGSGREACDHAAVRGRAAARSKPRRRGPDRRDHRHRPGAHLQRRRGRRARPAACGRPRPPGGQPAARRRHRPPARTPYLPDLRWPAQRLIVEIDSAWHDDPLSQQLDAERQAELEAAGERVLRDHEGAGAR